MSLHVSDPSKLPAALRKQVEAPRRKRRGQATGSTPGHCWACGLEFASYGRAWERHSTETGHRRFELVVS